MVILISEGIDVTACTRSYDMAVSYDMTILSAVLSLFSHCTDADL